MSQSITVKIPYAKTCGASDWVSLAVLGGIGVAAVVTIAAFASSKGGDER